MKLDKNQQGASLIEVAITVLVLASSLLAMSTLQTRSLQFNQSAYMRTQANIHAYDIIDRMRLNRGTDNQARLVDYDTPYADVPSGNPVAVTDVNQWRANISKNLPGGQGAISCVGRICTISIKWSESSLFGSQSSSNPEATSELKFTSSI